MCLCAVMPNLHRFALIILLTSALVLYPVFVRLRLRLSMRPTRCIYSWSLLEIRQLYEDRRTSC